MVLVSKCEHFELIGHLSLQVSDQFKEKREVKRAGVEKTD